MNHFHKTLQICMETDLVYTSAGVDPGRVPHRMGEGTVNVPR